MNKIKIWFDPSLISDEKAVKIYRSIEEYPELYERVKNSVLDNEESEFIIQNVQMLNWVKGLNSFDPGDFITVEEISLRGLLEQNWGNIKIPEYMSEKDLKFVLEEVPQPKVVCDFENIIISHYLGVYFDENVFIDDIKVWINQFPYNEFEQIVKKSLFYKVWIRKKSELLANSNKGIHNLISLFFDNPKKFRTLIISYQLLKSYSLQLKKRFCGDYIESLNSLVESEIIKIDINSDELLEIKNAIAIELNSMLTNCEEKLDILSVISCTSGRLEKEFYIIINFLKVNSLLNVEEVREQVYVKYRELLSKNLVLMNNFEQLKRPKYPINPEKIDDFSTLIKWAKDEYLPYRTWLNKQNIIDKDIEQYSIQYSDYFYKNYIDIMFSYPYVMWKMIPNIKVEIDKQNFTILLVIDNLNHNYFDYLISLFNEEDISIIESKDYVAMAPTETKFSKTALFSSNYEYENKEQNYRNIFNKKMKSYFLTKKFHYTTEISTIDNLDDTVNFLVINFGEIDEYLHKDQGRMARSRDEKIKDELRAFFMRVWRVIENKPDADIYITSDHGSLKVSQEHELLVDQDLLEGKYIEKSERVMTVTERELQKSRELFEKEGYILRKDFFSLDTHYVVAKGDSSFKPIKGEYYVHGGLSPEETIVPFIHLKKSNLKLIKPTILIEENQYRYNVKTKLILSIENPNDVPLINLSINLDSDIVAVTDMKKQVNLLKELSKVTIEFDEVRILNKNRQNNELIVHLEYSVYGKHFNYEYRIPIKVNSIQENTFDFDDFDF
ncbi:hypothetical protein ACFFGV_20240 [Pontibacillus salicampi]|uniref:PglZ domain-containing protein n=1 Tax=Pontibacillus salicampi TaxID=1449801 RepID=A0ABV6LU22_9BACI